MMLNKGDKIAFIAPSGWFEQNDLRQGLAWFENQGFKPVISKNAYDRCFYEAGTSENRAEDIHQAFLNPDIKAIFCIRGGAGALNVLDKIDYDIIRQNPKPVFGLSDSTALQNALFTKANNISYTGFLPIYDFKSGAISPLTEKSLLNILHGVPFSTNQFDIINNKDSEGTLVGGCLSVFTSLCGTPYFPNLEDKIILIEDVGEKTYHIDLMLQQLKLQKGFNKIKGLIFGSFENCIEADIGDGQIDDIIHRFVKNLDVPVVYNLAYGHIKDRLILPIGKKIRMNLSSLCIQEVY